MIDPTRTTLHDSVRVIAVDWSGAKSGERRKIWLAEVRAGRMVRLESGRSREEVVAHLAAEAVSDSPLIVGLELRLLLSAVVLRETGRRGRTFPVAEGCGVG